MADPSPLQLTAEEILAGLNAALMAECQAVVDYDLHARASSQPEIREALETLRDVEREHAGRLAGRVLALGGTPSGETPEPQAASATLAASLAQDLIGEQWAIVEYARLVAGIVDDDNTAELMAELLLDEISHAVWLKATLRSL